MKRRSLLGEFCASTTCHGLGRAAEAEGWARAAWVAAIGLSCLGLVATLAQVVQDLSTHPTATQLQVRVREVGGEGAMRFPDVLLCPKLSVNESRLLRLGLSEELFFFIWARTRPVPSRHIPKLWSEYEEFLGSRWWGRDLRELFVELGPRCSELFALCRQGQDAAGEFDCCEAVEAEVTEAGLCFRLPSRGQVAWTGDFGALTLHLKNLRSFWLPGKRDFAVSGVQLRVEKYYNPRRFGGLELGAGRRTLVSVEEEASVRINAAFQRPACQERHPEQSYTAADCSEVCYARKVIEACGCFTLSTPESLGKLLEWPGLGYATCPLNSTCLKDWLGATECQAPQCLPSCEQWAYRLSVSSAPLRALGESSPNSTAADDSLQLQIQFHSFEVREMREVSTVTLSSVIGSVGGVLGVFLGASVLTILEILTFAVQATVQLCKDGRKNKPGL